MRKKGGKIKEKIDDQIFGLLDVYTAVSIQFNSISKKYTQ